MTPQHSSGPANSWPVDVAEEKAALGVCLLGRAHDATRLLTAEDFGLSAHREIFECLCALVARGEATLEISLLAHELQSRGRLEAIGDVAYLADLDYGVVPERAMESRVRLLREMAERRRVLRIAEEAIERASDLCQPIAQTQAWLREAV